MSTLSTTDFLNHLRLEFCLPCVRKSVVGGEGRLGGRKRSPAPQPIRAGCEGAAREWRDGNAARQAPGPLASLRGAEGVA